MQKLLSDPVRLGRMTLQNRICVPPMVMFGYTDDSGVVNDRHVAHYRALAKGGAGLIIQEATCICPEGRLSLDQLGVWDDSFLPGLGHIAQAVHEEGGKIIMQIHHAGLISVARTPAAPSAYVMARRGKAITGHEMSETEIEKMMDDFIAAAVRAQKAGYDGVELHGCHGYLLCQFLNNRVNRRTDRFQDPMNVLAPIITGIRKATDFALGIRLGCFEPTLADGIAHAMALDKMGVDFLDVSYGFSAESQPECPEDFPYKDVVYAAGEIKKRVSVPVFAVNHIRTPEDAQGVIDNTDVDMVDIGSSMLVDPEWANKALSGQEPGKCLDCDQCAFRRSSKPCSGQLLMDRRNEEKKG